MSTNEKNKKSHRSPMKTKSAKSTETSNTVETAVATPATSATTAAATPTATAPPALSSPPSIPSADDVAKWTSLLDGVSTMLGESATPMTTQQRRRSLKLRKGGEPMVGLLSGLGSQYNVQLPGVDPQALQTNILLAQRLQPLDTKLRAVAALVSDTVANAKTQSWQGTTALYTALVRASSRSPSLQTELKPAVDFFSVKAKREADGTSKKKGKGASVASSPPTEAVASTAAAKVAAPEVVTPTSQPAATTTATTAPTAPSAAASTVTTA
jgi:hypothetical protein